MPYHFVQERDDYTDLAAGAVLYSLPGQTAFPVRLASEIFQRCQAHLHRRDRVAPYTVYDPCCGSAYLLVTTAYLHWSAIAEIIASDADPTVQPLAERNLALLTLAGIETRITQLAQLQQQFGKPAHAQALASAERLRNRLLAVQQIHPIHTATFVANALDGDALCRQLPTGAIDIILTDLPYGQQTTWQDADPTLAAPAPAWQLLAALRAVMNPATILAVTTTKAQKVAHDAYQRVEQFQLGKRRTTFFMLKP